MASTPSVARQCPDTVPMEHKTPTKRHRNTGLAEAHDCSSGHRTPQPPSLDHLWKCYPSKEGLELEKIKTHMTRMSWLCNGKWNPDRLSKDGLKERPGVTEHPAFKCIVDIFNDLLQYHQSPEGRRGVESTSFDGSSMLDVVPLLLESLRELAEKAEEISIEESTVPSTVERLATGIIVGQCQSPPQAATPQAESDIAGPFRGIDTGT